MTEHKLSDDQKISIDAGKEAIDAIEKIRTRLTGLQCVYFDMTLHGAGIVDTFRDMNEVEKNLDNTHFTDSLIGTINEHFAQAGLTLTLLKMK